MLVKTSLQFSDFLSGNMVMFIFVCCGPLSSHALCVSLTCFALILTELVHEYSVNVYHKLIYVRTC